MEGEMPNWVSSSNELAVPRLAVGSVVVLPVSVGLGTPP
jgi:hypothetical protein